MKLKYMDLVPIYSRRKNKDFNLILNQSKVNGRKISLVRFELTKVETVKSSGYDDIKDKISKQNWSHPFVTTTPGAFRIEPWLMDLSMGISKVTVQNTINSNIKITVVGLYFNEKNELIGVGASDSFELAALGSTDVDVAVTNLSSVPVRIEYYAEMNSSLGVREMMDILYP